ncbi:MAG: hypothetical protein KJ718_02475 [Nanoarchaeota archaeon]|nr:hypothetical protein [Nanoarchaeota archaeon]MBU1051396.1 hypothetical protein [Nanoarchaeota archaeon]MBU1988599.1 hypothetical protein [Nanoarchaeota archaeon]
MTTGTQTIKDAVYCFLADSEGMQDLFERLNRSGKVARGKYLNGVQHYSLRKDNGLELEENPPHFHTREPIGLDGKAERCVLCVNTKSLGNPDVRVERVLKMFEECGIKLEEMR